MWDNFESNLTAESFKDFLYWRPGIRLSDFCRDAGVSLKTVKDFLEGRTKPVAKTLVKIEITARKYGYEWDKKKD